MTTSTTSPTHLFWCDLETSGLTPEKDQILEIAWKLTSFDFPWIVREDPAACFDAVVFVDHGAISLDMPPDVLTMHRASGLLSAINQRQGTALDLLERDLLSLSADWPQGSTREDREARVMIAGSSAHFDLGFLRAHMPRFARRLSYRVFDVSAVRAFCRSLGMPRIARDGTDPAHRAKADLEASMAIGKDCVDWIVNRPRIMRR